MLFGAYLLAVTTGFTFYPAFGDFTDQTGDARLEAAIDKGLIYELVVNCGDGTAIVSYSKVERLFCTPVDGCGRNVREAFTRACNP